MNADVPVADVIIIGSGPAGVSAAWPLLEAGVSVLMLDAGEPGLPAVPRHGSVTEWRADPRRWQAELGTAGALGDNVISPKFATPLARAALHGFAAAAGLTTHNYVAVGALAAGGLSRIWGALAARYSEADLAKFPYAPESMAASYERVAQRIGVAAATPIAAMPPIMLTPPVARFVRRHLLQPSDGFQLATAPNAVLTTEGRSGRDPCNACGLCLYGCTRGSIYSSAAELTALRRFANFTYRSGVCVEQLRGGAGMQVVKARYRGEEARFAAPVVVLAAGTLMTTSLALRRLGLTGRPFRLESNPVGGIAFLTPQLIGAALPATSFGLGQLFYSVQAEEGTNVAGVFYGADTLPLDAVANRLPFRRGFALRTARALAPALILATGYLPGRYSVNRLTVEDDGVSGRIHVDGGHAAEADALLRTVFGRLARHARRRGAWRVPGSLQLLPPGSDAHPAATLPMGGSGGNATDAAGELNGAPGVFVVDGAALPVLSERHPTFTIMANADRIGRMLARRLAINSRLRLVS